MTVWKNVICSVAAAIAVTSWAAAQPENRGRGDAGNPSRPGAAERVTGEISERTEQAERGAGAAVERRPEEAARAGDNPGQRGSGQMQQAAGQRMAAMARQAAQFDSIHLRRMAQLERLQELAAEHDRVEVLERVDDLIEREMARYQRQLAQLQDRMERAESLPDLESTEQDGEE